jgi:hypothetical protein
MSSSPPDGLEALVVPALIQCVVQCSAVRCSAETDPEKTTPLGAAALKWAREPRARGTTLTLCPGALLWVQCSAVQCSAVQCSAVQCSAVQQRLACVRSAPGDCPPAKASPRTDSASRMARCCTVLSISLHCTALNMYSTALATCTALGTCTCTALGTTLHYLQHFTSYSTALVTSLH